MEAAGTIIARARELFPDNADLLVSEGKYRYSIMDYAGASRSLNTAIAISPKLITPYILLNHIMTDMDGNLEGAIAIAQKGLEQDPGNIALTNNLAYTLLQTDKKENIRYARRLLDKVVGVQDVYLLATRGLLYLKEEGDVEAASKYYNWAASTVTDVNLSNLVKQKKMLEIGKFFMKNNNKTQAVKHLRKALRIKTASTIYLDQIKALLACGAEWNRAGGDAAISESDAMLPDANICRKYLGYNQLLLSDQSQDRGHKA
jgi:tetratricopeptide (TPR) repeat protein